MSAAPLNPLSLAVTRVLSKSKEIAAMPQTIFRAMEMAGDETTSTARMEATIMVDPGFSAKILAVANSAAFGMPRRVTSIRDAVGLLGFVRVKQIAMTVGAYDMFLGKTDKESLRRRGWWRHSLEVAYVGKAFAARAGFGQADQVFAAGLLHLIGKTLLCRFDPAAYDDVDKYVVEGQDELTAEKLAYGCNHIDVAVAAGTEWGFPTELCNAMDYLSQPETGATSEYVTHFVALSHYLVTRHNHPTSTMPPPLWAFNAVAFDFNQIQTYLEMTKTVIDSIIPSGA